MRKTEFTEREAGPVVVRVLGAAAVRKPSGEQKAQRPVRDVSLRARRVCTRQGASPPPTPPPLPPLAESAKAFLKQQLLGGVRRSRHMLRPHTHVP